MIRSYFAKKAYSHKDSVVNTNLAYYIEKVSKVFNLNSAKIEDQSHEKIKEYYRKSYWAYKFFHNNQSYIHFPICDPKSIRANASDYEQPLELVDHFFQETQKQAILELSPGKGANALYLLKKHHNVTYDGIDLVQKPLKELSEFSNYSHSYGDYHDLSRYEDNRYDVCFVIEALCYSEKKDVVLEEVYRKLRPGGYFIIFDGYANGDVTKLNTQYQTIIKLIEYGMALNKIEELPTFRETIERSQLTLVKEIDFSTNIIPALRKLEYMSRGYFKYPKLAKAIIRIFGVDMAKNSLAGLFMWSMLENNIGGYYCHILRKPPTDNT